MRPIALPCFRHELAASADALFPRVLRRDDVRHVSWGRRRAPAVEVLEQDRVALALVGEHALAGFLIPNAALVDREKPSMHKFEAKAEGVLRPAGRRECHHGMPFPENRVILNPLALLLRVQSEAFAYRRYRDEHSIVALDGEQRVVSEIDGDDIRHDGLSGPADQAD